MGHDIVFQLLFLLAKQIPVETALVILHLVDCLLGNLLQFELLFSLGQPNPQLAPQNGLNIIFG